MAHTLTHLLVGVPVGWTFGWTFFPDTYYLGILFCAGASIAPDLVMVPQFAFDRFRGRKALKKQSSTMMFWKEVGHSLPLWGTFTLVALFLPLWILSAAIGGLLHAVIDVPTHGKGTRKDRQDPENPDINFWDTDATYMWPTRMDLRPFGLCEYRRGTGNLKPKWPELVIDLLLLAWIGVLVLSEILERWQ